MATLLIEYRVTDYPGWKAMFDRDPLGRKQHGVTHHRLYSDADDPGHLMLSLDFSSSEEARAFLGALQPMWEVSGATQAWVLNEVDTAGS